MKKIYLQSNNHADRKPSQLIKKEKKTHVSKTGRNKIRRKNPKKIVKPMEKLKNLNDSRPFQQTSMSQQQYSHTHTHKQKEGRKKSFLFVQEES